MKSKDTIDRGLVCRMVGLPSSASDEQVRAAIDEMRAGTPLHTRIKGLTMQAGVSAGLIRPERRKAWEEACDRDLQEAQVTMLASAPAHMSPQALAAAEQAAGGSDSPIRRLVCLAEAAGRPVHASVPVGRASIREALKAGSTVGSAHGDGVRKDLGLPLTADDKAVMARQRQVCGLPADATTAQVAAGLTARRKAAGQSARILATAAPAAASEPGGSGLQFLESGEVRYKGLRTRQSPAGQRQIYCWAGWTDIADFEASGADFLHAQAAQKHMPRGDA